MPSCRSTVDRYQSIGALEPELLEDRRVERLRQAADVVERGLRDLADLAQVRPQRRAFRRLLARRGRASSPSRSGSGRTRRAARARSRAASTRASAISFCASSRRSSDSAASCGEQPPVRANQIQAGQRRWRPASRRGTSRPAAAPRVDVLDLLRRLLLGLVVLDQQPRDRRAERRLPRLQRQPDLARASSSWPVPGELEHAIGGVPELRERAGQVLRCSGRPPGDSHALLLRRARRPDPAGCGRTAPTRRSADSARSASSMSRIASASWFRSFWMRRSCSESLRLRSVRSVCSRRRPEICPEMYHE